MTLPSEEVYALYRTREFLRSLMDPKATKVPKSVRAAASGCLRHYPWQSHVEERWGEDVCEHGDMRIFCRKCKEVKR